MVALYKDPDGEKIFSSSANGRSSICTWTNGNGAEGEQTAEISSLRKRVTELELTLAKMKVI